LGNCRVYVARILYYYHKSSINTGFLDRNVNKNGVFFVKYAHFLLDNDYENWYYMSMINKITLPKPMMIDDIDIDRLKKKFDNNDIHYNSITTDGYLITIITNAIPMSILNLLKSKFTFMYVDKINNTNKGVKHYV